MVRNWVLLLILTLPNGRNSTEGESEKLVVSDEKRLIRQLLRDYELSGRIGRPVLKVKDKVIVEMSLSLIQILDLDEKNQVLTINVWIRYLWRDSIVQWNPVDYAGIESVRIPSNFMWTPDIVLYNYADERMREMREASAIVQFNGSISWMPPAIFKSSCKIDITYFPFDRQFCHLKFGSWTYDGHNVDVQFIDNVSRIDTNDYTESNEWEIVDCPAIRNVKYYPCCLEPYPDLTYFLFLRRNAAFKCAILVLPCILLAFLTLIIFWLPPDSPAKMVLGMNIFVAFFLLLLLLADSTPQSSSSVPYLGFYYCMNMGLIVLSSFLSVIVINLYVRTGKSNPVPTWIRHVMSILATILYMPHARCQQSRPSESMISCPKQLNSCIDEKSNAEPSSVPRVRMGEIITIPESDFHESVQSFLARPTKTAMKSRSLDADQLPQSQIDTKASSKHQSKSLLHNHHHYNSRESRQSPSPKPLSTILVDTRKKRFRGNQRPFCQEMPTLFDTEDNNAHGCQCFVYTGNYNSTRLVYSNLRSKRTRSQSFSCCDCHGVAQCFYCNTCAYCVDMYARQGSEQGNYGRRSYQSNDRLDKLEMLSTPSSEGSKFNCLCPCVETLSKHVLKLETHLSELRHSINAMTKHISAKDLEGRITHEWRMLAILLDRVFFYSYLVVHVVAVVSLLIQQQPVYSVEETVTNYKWTHYGRGNDVSNLIYTKNHTEAEPIAQSAWNPSVFSNPELDGGPRTRFSQAIDPLENAGETRGIIDVNDYESYQKQDQLSLLSFKRNEEEPGQS